MILQGDCATVLKDFESNSIDLTVTSPPYDDLRSYGGHSQFDFEIIAKQLYRVTKQGGIVVWIIGDQSKDFNESGTSFKQSLYFKEIGFNLYDTMIYAKNGSPTLPHDKQWYRQVFEYMFILSKGKPKTYNPIKDVRNKTPNKKNRSHWRNPKTGKMEYGITTISQEFRIRSNIWFYDVGGSITRDKISFNHPAMFPEKLIEDHIKSWSNEGDIILDPFLGSGTTYKMALKLNRKPIGIEINPEYIQISKQRIIPYLQKIENWIISK